MSLPCTRITYIRGGFWRAQVRRLFIWWNIGPPRRDLYLANQDERDFICRL